jgi:hypothetical protein
MKHTSSMPFVLRSAAPSEATWELNHRDIPATEDSLPAAVSIDAAGYARSRRTMTTDVQRETSDEN